MHPHPRDPRQRRAGGRPFAPPIDTAAAAIRLEVAAASMRADQLDRGPDTWAPVDETTIVTPELAAAVQLGTHEPPMTAQEFAAALGRDLDDFEGREPLPGRDYDPADVLADVEPEPEPVAESPLPPSPSLPPAPTAAPDPAPVFISEQPRSLTWASRHDPRSLAYGVRAALAGSAPLTDRLLPVDVVLDQGTEGQCVGCAVVDATNVLRDLADPRPGGLDLSAASAIYRRAQQIDEMPGEAYSGTSVLAGMQAAVEAGYFGGYRWAFGTRDVAQAVLQLGPVVVGVPWLSGMYETGPGGLVTLTGQDTGQGHALVVVGLKLKGPQGQPGPYFAWLNSWGESYGEHGIGWIHHRDLAALLHGTGEAAIPLPEPQVPTDV
jgi:hypothetical protein